MNRGDPSAAEFFETRYASAADADPWRFASAEYELARYRALLGALPRARYRRALEPGCSVGVLTAQLAARCDTVLALDFAPTAAAEAFRRCQGRRVEIRCVAFPQGVSAEDGPFDLIVLAELAYYFSEPALVELARTLSEWLSPGGDLVAQHWTGVSPDHRLSGKCVHDRLKQSFGAWESLTRQTHSGFLLDAWRRPRDVR